MYEHIILILFSMLFYMYVYCLYNAIISISIWSCVWSSSLLDSFSYEIISLTIYAFENALCWCCRKQMGLQDIVCFYHHPADQSSHFICCCYCFFFVIFLWKTNATDGRSTCLTWCSLHYAITVFKCETCRFVQFIVNWGSQK